MPVPDGYGDQDNRDDIMYNRVQAECEWQGRDLQDYLEEYVYGVVRESRELTKQEELQFAGLVLEAKRKEIDNFVSTATAHPADRQVSLKKERHVSCRGAPWCRPGPCLPATWPAT